MNYHGLIKIAQSIEDQTYKKDVLKATENLRASLYTHNHNLIKMQGFKELSDKLGPITKKKHNELGRLVWGENSMLYQDD